MNVVLAANTFLQAILSLPPALLEWGAMFEEMDILGVKDVALSYKISWFFTFLIARVGANW